MVRPGRLGGGVQFTLDEWYTESEPIIPGPKPLFDVHPASVRLAITLANAKVFTRAGFMRILSAYCPARSHKERYAGRN